MLQQSKPTWSQHTSDDLLVRLIIHENLSFQIVESQYFQQYVQYQRNTNIIPSSGSTVKEKIIKNHEKAQTKVKSLLSSALSLIHLSIDGWTTPHQTMGILGAGEAASNFYFRVRMYYIISIKENLNTRHIYNF